MYTTISHSEVKTQKRSFSFVNIINQWIEKNKVNYFGLSALFLGVGTGLASIPVAIAVSLDMFIISTICVILAMAGNVTVISQQSLKTIIWTFFIGMSVNTLLMVYLIWMSFA